MNETDIRQKLDKLADLRVAGEVLVLEKQALVETILTDEIKAKLAEIDAEFDGKIGETHSMENELENEIKAMVLAVGASVKGTWLHAIYNPGKVSWDSKALDIWGKVHPEILGCRKQGEPFMTLRGVK